LTIIAFILTATPTIRTTSADEAGKTNIIVYICDSATAATRPWRNTLSRAIAGSVARPAGAHVSVRGEAQCGAANVEIACTAGVYDAAGPVMACAPGTLLSLIRVAAWYAIKHTTGADEDEDYEMFRLRHPPRLGLSAFVAANDVTPGSTLATQIEDLRKRSEDTEVVPGATRTQLVFRATVDLVFSALIGHESSHLESQPPYCATEAASRVEETGLWKVLVRIASSDELYKPETPDVGEVRADRCATRRIRVARTSMEKTGLSAKDQDFSRRAAADIVSTMLLVRFDQDNKHPSMTLNDSYLYTPLRIAALAGEFGLDQTAPAICGGAAENLTEAVQFTMKQRPGKGALPDEVENLFPKGVIAAWERRASWSTASFSCN